MSPISEYALSTLPLRIQEAPEWHESDFPVLIHDRLIGHKVLQHYVHNIDFEVDDGTLVLRGRLPSFYLKQTLQTALHDLPGILHVDNQVEVRQASGVDLFAPSIRELVYD